MHIDPFADGVRLEIAPVTLTHPRQCLVDRHTLRVDVYDRRTGPETPGRLLHNLRIENRRGVDADLLRPRLDQLRHILDRPDASADRKWHKTLLGHLPDHLIRDVPRLMAGGDVQEHQLVRARFVVLPRDLYRIARVAEVNKVDALDDSALVHIQARDNAVGEHRDMIVIEAT